jgi:hypothetical protein
LFRFSVVGPLLSSPPSPGELATELAALAATTWQHPIRHEPVRFGLKTIETWYYAAKNAAEPITALRPKVRRTLGQHPSLGPGLGEALRAQYAAHPSWTYNYARAVVMHSPGASTSSSCARLLTCCA